MPRELQSAIGGGDYHGDSVDWYFYWWNTWSDPRASEVEEGNDKSWICPVPPYQWGVDVENKLFFG
jgi:hypothetical protein